MIVEFLGTPGSGKNAVITQLSSRYSCDLIQASYSPKIHKGQFELKILRSIIDTYARVDMLISQKKSEESMTFINRGILDRVTWCRFLATLQPSYSQIADDMEKALRESELIKSIDLFCLFVSPYQFVKNRKQSKYKSPNVLNFEAIENLNKIYSDLFHEFKELLPIAFINEIDENLSVEQKVNTVQDAIIELR